MGSSELAGLSSAELEPEKSTLAGGRRLKLLYSIRYTETYMGRKAFIIVPYCAFLFRSTKQGGETARLREDHVT